AAVLVPALLAAHCERRRAVRARRHAPEIRGREEDGTILLEIADTGHGIPADELETVWEELSRSRESRGIEGTGLGLPLVRAILERHGGRATLESWHGEG